MQIFHKLLFTVILVSLAGIVAAQQTEKPVRFVNGDFITGSNISRGSFKKENISNAVSGDTYYLLVQFSTLPSLSTRQKMKEAGIQLSSYLPGDAFLAAIKNNFDFSRAASFNISSINAIPAFYKIHSRLQTYQPDLAKKDANMVIAVNYFEQADKAMVIAELTKAGAFILSEKYTAGHFVTIQYNRSVINTIAALPFVSSLGLQPENDQPLNYNSRAAHGVSGLNAVNGKNLNGKGVTVGVGDDADVSTHIDFAGRLINRSPWIPNNHGTHTTGTTAGAGIVNIKNRGTASKATIVSQYFSDIIVNAPGYITDYNMVVTNNSYHSAENGCAGEREYNSLSSFGDDQLFNNRQLLHVFASGNDGETACSPYPTSFGTLKSGWQTAKNILTVGAVRVDINPTIATYSGRGPAADGRIKPEITADGYAVISTIKNNSYGINYGTSMACPAVTGGLTLLYERYRQTHAGADPTSALIKAIACNTAEDLGNPGPDYTYGFGMLNVRRAVEAIDSNRYFINTISGVVNEIHNITVPSNARRLKIMLYWNDVPAANNAATTLVNDIDLAVIEPSMTVHRPLTLNSAPASVNNIATEAPDHVNNIEQVVIENPAAGVYSANINSYSLPSGSQDYVVTYEIIQNSITVEYPFGGETLVPGETENIRWNAYGNESNNFTIEYSTDNGTNWTTINNNVAAASRIYSWVVPATVTNNALIRISRNGTSLVDQSDFNFTVLGQPTVTATNVCEGAVQLDWAAISSATTYDVLQLTADSMKVIGNTATQSYLITGLDKNKTYWFGVVAKNNTVAGRRSISVSALPNSGTCSLSNFNNDIKVDSILEPNTARQYFSNSANASKPVKVSIKNLGTIAVTGPYNVSFDYGGTIVTETINTTIAAGASLTYTFTGMYPLPPSPGYKYNFKAWVTKAADNNHLNDTAYKTVKYINNDPITVLPLTEGFETMPATEAKSGDMAIGDNKYLDFFSSNTRGRARTFVNTGFAYGGSKALTLDQAPYNANGTADSAIFNYNLANFAGKQVRFDFYYKNQGQGTSENGNRVWIRGSESNNWVEAYNLYDNQADIGEWKKALININDVLNNAVPAQTMGETFQVKLGQQGYASANSIYPLVDIDDGYTFDNLVLNEANNDVAVTAINSPGKAGCGLVSNTPISVKIKNYHNTTLNNIQISYQVNGGAVVTETIPTITANQALDYVFTQRANLAAYIDYNINVWVKYSTDTYAANDSLLNYVVHNSPIISSYPYYEGFENSNGNFYANGKNATWQWGVPAKTKINKAANGTKVWANNLAGNYSDNETSFLYTPCFDLTGLSRPVLSFSHIFDIETDYDYSWVEYSTDGKTWNRLGNVNEGTNWYDNAVDNNWRLSNTKWHVASIDIPVTNTTVKFRFVLSSDAGVTQEGIGVDDVRVYEKMEVAKVNTATAAVTAAASGNNWINFNQGDSVLAAINPNGQNLGTVSVTPYLNKTGTVKNSNGQYYLDRNYVLTSTNNPTGNIGVRLYFTDAEVNALINATGCASCGKPINAYELGIEKYHGGVNEENGVLEDNFFNTYQFVLPANTTIIPNGNGYYAEFTVADFSEFWLSKGDIAPLESSTCPGSPITYTATGGATYQWQVDDGTGYTNITNGVNYSGATTNSMQVSNVPTSYSGYKYRCLVDGVGGTVYTLRFKNVWLGNTNTDWFTASNWLCGTVPDQYTDVVIPPGKTKYPILTASTAIRSIRALASSPVTINTGVILDVKGR